MMSSASERHRRLEDILVPGRVFGTLTREADDHLSEEMSDLWLEMTREEQVAAEARVRAFAIALENQVQSDYLQASFPQESTPLVPLNESLTVLSQGTISRSGVDIQTRFVGCPPPSPRFSVVERF